MQTVAEINDMLHQAHAYERRYPRDKSIRADVTEFLQMRDLAQRKPTYFAQRADPQQLARKLDELNDAWQELMASPRDRNAQMQVRVLTEELFRTIVTAQRFQDGEYN